MSDTRMNLLLATLSLFALLTFGLLLAERKQEATGCLEWHLDPPALVPVGDVLIPVANTTCVRRAP